MATDNVFLSFLFFLIRDRHSIARAILQGHIYQPGIFPRVFSYSERIVPSSQCSISAVPLKWACYHIVMSKPDSKSSDSF